MHFWHFTINNSQIGKDEWMIDWHRPVWRMVCSLDKLFNCVRTWSQYHMTLMLIGAFLNCCMTQLPGLLTCWRFFLTAALSSVQYVRWGSEVMLSVRECITEPLNDHWLMTTDDDDVVTSLHKTLKIPCHSEQLHPVIITLRHWCCAATLWTLRLWAVMNSSLTVLIYLLTLSHHHWSSRLCCGKTSMTRRDVQLQSASVSSVVTNKLDIL